MDLDTKQAFDKLTRALPSVAFEYVTVKFPATANQDTVVPTVLRPNDPNAILYKVVDWQFLSAPATTPCVYRNSSATHRLWTPGNLILRCNVSNAICVLELTLQRTF